ncbi:MAG: phosphodiester glycosidase family protein [Hyphomicrobiales bacterium]
MFFFIRIAVEVMSLIGMIPLFGVLPDYFETLGECNFIRFEATPFTVCTFDTERHTLKLFHSDPEGTVYRHFDGLAETLQRHGQSLVFAMNAGMYHSNRDAVGLFIEEGIERSKINRNAGPGNFHLLPNGIFYLQGNRAGVAATETYLASGVQPDFATQSGPMLVIDGKLHPRFIRDGTSRKIRNGVGVSNDGQTVTFALSEERVNFHDFGRLFRDHLNIDNALFRDGSISRIYVRDLQRNDPGRAMGPIVGVVEATPLPDGEDATE